MTFHCSIEIQVTALCSFFAFLFAEAEEVFCLTFK